MEFRLPQLVTSQMRQLLALKGTGIKKMNSCLLQGMSWDLLQVEWKKDSQNDPDKNKSSTDILQIPPWISHLVEEGLEAFYWIWVSRIEELQSNLEW